jgi:hypothetical protein
MPAPDIIKQLVEQFERDLESYRSVSYKEAQLREEFLNPFFEALGWDMSNRSRKSFDDREVIHEDAMKIEDETKAPDYAFKVGRERKFFVEAKKPAVNIETSIDPAYQVRSYAWSASLPLSILTDFEEFSVYDCRFEPKYGDKASVARVTSMSFREYVEKWDEIASVFSREAVGNGSFDKYAEEVKTKKGTVRIDEAILAEIEKWRDLLARNIAVREPDLSVGQLNYAVQAIIDRIIFLRICEDRKIEPYGQLRTISAEKNIYEGLTRLFQKADAKYNSGLFHFRDEKEQSSYPDSFTLNLNVDDKVLKEILTNLYFPKSPYKFKEIPIEILGKIYEQFLGKVIRLTPSHQAKVEVKPEVKKAGGVFYTPTFIVLYIVINTLGKLLIGLTPKEAAKLKIVDPACGSGTFLLGAYQYLLDWHLNWYLNNDPEKWTTGKKPALYKIAPSPNSQNLGRDGEGYRLTGAKKKEILLNNIYGVDIDAQAVEVTKLSLLLKVLEDESAETIGSQLALFQERVLPDLGKNIKCGNSLIAPDYWDGQFQGNGGIGISDEERAKVNAFDWQTAFPEVFAQGGFDVVFGNPPYIRIQAMREWASEQVEYYAKKYKAASKGNYDIYVVFVEKALSLLNKNGKLGFILPHKFFNAQYGEPLRGVLASGKHLSKIVHFGDQQVFSGATTYTCLMFLNKQGVDEFEFTKVSDLENWCNFQSQTSEVLETSEVSGVINASQVTESEWNFSVGKGAGLFEKLSQMPVKLGDVVERIYQGPITSADTVFLFKDFKDDNSKTISVFSKENDSWVKLEKGILRKVIRSGSIGRYKANTTAYVLFPYKITGTNATLLSVADMQSKYPLAWTYLEKNKKVLENREKGAFKDAQWYRFGRNQNLGMWEQPKLLIPYMITDLSAYYDINDGYYFINVTTGGYGIISDEGKGNYLYLCGLLNSHLLNFFFKQVSTTFHGGYFAANKQYIERLPIRPINFTDSADKARHDKMVSLVERMLELHKRNPRTPQEKESLAGEIKSTDRAIDELVYQLYGLSEDEIRIVES